MNIVKGKEEELKAETVNFLAERKQRRSKTSKVKVWSNKGKEKVEEKSKK